jgi:hypothetical protein
MRGLDSIVHPFLPCGLRERLGSDLMMPAAEAGRDIEMEVASPGLEGRQVAILRLKRGGLLPRNDYSVEPERRTRNTQMN